VPDVAQRKGYQFKGQATMVSKGETYRQIADPLKKRLPNLPPVPAVIVIKVEEAHSF
jgi:hypothetical protein